MDHGKRTKKIQMYLTPEAETDRMILDIWAAAGPRRPEIFRLILRAGIRALYEAGDITPELARKAKLHKHLPAVQVRAPVQAMPYPYPYSFPMPQHPMPPAPPAPEPSPQPSYLDPESLPEPEVFSEIAEIDVPDADPTPDSSPKVVDIPKKKEASSTQDDENPEHTPPQDPKHAILGLMGKTRTSGAR